VLQAVKPVEEEIGDHRTQHNRRGRHRDAFRFELQLEHVAPAGPLQDRVGDIERQRRDGADQKQHHGAQRHVEDACRAVPAPGGKQSFEHEAQRQHPHQNLKVPGLIDHRVEILQAADPVLRERAITVGAHQRNERAGDHRQEQSRDQGRRRPWQPPDGIERPPPVEPPIRAPPRMVDLGHAPECLF
jgi:hypothetical protein